MMFEEIPDNDTLQERQSQNKRLFVPTRFKFLQELVGLRPHGIHGLLATTGAGKSTLTRAIIADTSENIKCLLLLSEENPQTYFTGFMKQSETIRRENIIVLLEKTIADFSFNNDERFKFLFESILASDCKFVFWDNVTASRLFGDSLPISRRGEFFLKLIDFLKENNIGLFYIVHTDKTIGRNQTAIFTGNNARGSDAIRMATEYYFVMQGWTIKEKIFNFITIEKHREHTVRNRHFLLIYKEDTYKSDRVSSYEEVSMASKYMDDALKKIKKQFDG